MNTASLTSRLAGGCLSCSRRSAAANQADFTITTREGDTVSISMSSQRSSRMEVGSGSFTLRQITADTMVMNIQGDLSAAELADIGRLVDDLADIGRAFYGDDPATALAKALDIPDYGSLAGFNASFTRTEQVATRITSHHPLPASLPAASQELPQTAAGTNLQERWRQMEQYLDQRQPQDEKRNLPVFEEAEDFSSLLRDRLYRLMAEHPRLTPFLPPLTGRALDEVADELPDGLQKAARRLHDDLVAGIDDWLLAGPRDIDRFEPARTGTTLKSDSARSE